MTTRPQPLRQNVAPATGMARYFKWFEDPLHWWVRSTLAPEHPFRGQGDPGQESADLGIDPSKPICYVINSSSISDLLVLQRQCRRLRAPMPLKPLVSGGKTVSQASYAYLNRLGFYRKLREPGKEPSPQLLRLVQFAENDPTFDVQIVPVSVFWGRNPGREEKSLLKLLFFDDELAGVLQKSLIVAAQGRDCFVQLSKPVSIRQFVDVESADLASAAQRAQKLRRVLRVHFRRQRTAALGPVFYERGHAIRAILASRQVREAIEEESRKKNQSYQRSEAKAVHYVKEIAADTRYGVIRFFDIILHWVWHKIFDGIETKHIESIRPLAEKSSVVYVPCHRSHLDYLLISYSLFRAGMTTPHTAAGINLNFWPMGSLLRRAGAFYIRRTFRGNRLYTAVFNEYVHFLVARGHPIKFFLEGGRSRTGRLLRPKTGMLSMVVQSFMRNPEKPVVFVPVYVGYDKVMEVKTYLRELRGSGKKKESMGELLKARKILKSSHGKAYLSFGAPLDLGGFLSGVESNWEADAGRLDHRPAWMAGAVDDLANEIMRRINATSIVSPMSLFSLGLLSTPQKAMTEEDLCRFVDFALALLRQCPYSELTTIPTGTAKDLLPACEKFSSLRRFEHPGGDVIYLEESESSLVLYYRSNALHLFAIPALLASFFQHNDVVTIESLVEGCRVLYPFIALEYFLRWESKDFPGAVLDYIKGMVAMGLLDSNEESARRGEITRPAVTSDSYSHLMSLGRVMGQTVERYAIAAALLQHAGIGGVVARGTLESHSGKMSQRISILSGIKDPDIFDESVFQNLVDVLKSEKYVENAEGDLLRVQPKTAQLAERSMALLSVDVRATIQRTTVMATGKAELNQPRS